MLSLSLAFILSQDQTLRCCYLVFVLFRINCRKHAECVDRRPVRISLGFHRRCPLPGRGGRSTLESEMTRVIFYLVSCTTVSLRPDQQAANLSLVIVTIAILSMISCPRFQKRCKGTAFFRTRKLYRKFFHFILAAANFRNGTSKGRGGPV